MTYDNVKTMICPNNVFEGQSRSARERSISGEMIFRWIDGLPKLRLAPSKARVTDKEVEGEGKYDLAWKWEMTGRNWGIVDIDLKDR